MMTDWELFLRLRQTSPQADLSWRGTPVDDARMSQLLLEAVAGVLEPEWQEFLDPFLFSGHLPADQLPDGLPLIRHLHQLGHRLLQPALAGLPFRARCLLLFLMTDDLLQRTDPITCLYEAFHQKLPDQRLLEVFEHPGCAGFLVEQGRLTPGTAQEWERAARVHALWRAHDRALSMACEEFGDHCLEKKRPVEAEFLFRRMQALEEAREKPLSPEKQAHCLAAIGRTVRAQGRWPEAEPMLNQAAELFADLRKPGNLTFARVLTELAYGYEGDGDTDEALSLWRRAGGIYASVLPSDDPRCLEVSEAIERLQ